MRKRLSGGRRGDVNSLAFGRMLRPEPLEERLTFNHGPAFDHNMPRGGGLNDDRAYSQPSSTPAMYGFAYGDRATQRGPDQHGPDQHGPDQHGPDQHGPDQRGPDQHGPDQSGGVQSGGGHGGGGHGGPQGYQSQSQESFGENRGYDYADRPYASPDGGRGPTYSRNANAPMQPDGEFKRDGGYERNSDAERNGAAGGYRQPSPGAAPRAGAPSTSGDDSNYHTAPPYDSPSSDGKLDDMVAKPPAKQEPPRVPQPPARTADPSEALAQSSAAKPGPALPPRVTNADAPRVANADAPRVITATAASVRPPASGRDFGSPLAILPDQAKGDTPRAGVNGGAAQVHGAQASGVNGGGERAIADAETRSAPTIANLARASAEGLPAGDNASPDGDDASLEWHASPRAKVETTYSDADHGYVAVSWHAAAEAIASGNPAVAAAQAVSPVLLSGVHVNFEAVDRAFEAALEEISAMGDDLMGWLEGYVPSRWTMGAAAIVVVASGSHYLRRRRAASANLQSEEEISEWLFAQLQTPSARS